MLLCRETLGDNREDTIQPRAENVFSALFYESEAFTILYVLEGIKIGDPVIIVHCIIFVYNEITDYFFHYF